MKPERERESYVHLLHFFLFCRLDIDVFGRESSHAPFTSPTSENTRGKFVGEEHAQITRVFSVYKCCAFNLQLFGPVGCIGYLYLI